GHHGIPPWSSGARARKRPPGPSRTPPSGYAGPAPKSRRGTSTPRALTVLKQHERQRERQVRHVQIRVEFSGNIRRKTEARDHYAGTGNEYPEHDDVKNMRRREPVKHGTRLLHL